MPGFYFIWSASFSSPGDFGVMRHGREKGLANSTELYFYYEKTKRSGAFIRGFSSKKG